MKRIYISLLEYLNETPPEELEKDLKEFDRWNDVGPTVEEYLDYCDTDKRNSLK